MHRTSRPRPTTNNKPSQNSLHKPPYLDRANSSECDYVDRKGQKRQLFSYGRQGVNAERITTDCEAALTESELWCE